jgi:hypothetical protein
MKQRDIRDYLQDILNAINLAQSFVADVTFDEFQADPKSSRFSRILLRHKQETLDIVGFRVAAPNLQPAPLVSEAL